MFKSISEQPWLFMSCFFVAAAAMLLPELALAGGGGASNTGQAIAGVLCTVVSWFTGPVGKGIATLAIIVIGVGALMGKVSWGMAIIVGVGVAVIFGAETIVNDLGDGGGFGEDCDTQSRVGPNN